jgi:hypothetical protein
MGRAVGKLSGEETPKPLATCWPTSPQKLKLSLRAIRAVSPALLASKLPSVLLFNLALASKKTKLKKHIKPIPTI